MMLFFRRLLIGRPLHNRDLVHERLPKWKALAIFSSDALSSVGYGPEQIVVILAVPGILAYGFMPHIAGAILLLLTILTVSYVQVARANPGGGGSYSAAMQNTGELPALVAAASLFADYVLTVAVSVSSGTEALTSAFPALVPYTVGIDLAVLFGLLMLINLRGVRESSNVFVLPTYAFIFGIVAMIGRGCWMAFTGHTAFFPAESTVHQNMDWAMMFLILRAFASGCSSVTGVEAISNGVPMFKEPEVHNAAATTYWMTGTLGFMLAGISLLIMHHHLVPLENVTLLSQLAERVFGREWLYFYVQITTMLVLYLAANTSYNGLPPLLSILAKDGYMPRYLGARGERLSFSNGIILLSIASGLLIWGFEGNVEHLIALYAIGVFLSFTIAQTSMVVHWHRDRSEKGWLGRAIINGVGAVVTGIVVLVIAVSKFTHGAWVILVFIPIMVLIFKKIRAHYDDVADELHLPLDCDDPVVTDRAKHRNLVIIPIASPTRVVAETLRYARSISDDITLLHVATDPENGAKIRAKIECWNPGIPLVTVYSPYRVLMRPLFDYIEKLEAGKDPDDFITVLIPEFETTKLWHRFLHNQTGWILRTMLMLKGNVVVAGIPYHLKK